MERKVFLVEYDLLPSLHEAHIVVATDAAKAFEVVKTIFGGLPANVEPFILEIKPGDKDELVYTSV